MWRVSSTFENRNYSGFLSNSERRAGAMPQEASDEANYSTGMNLAHFPGAVYVCDAPEGPFTSKVPVESGCTMANPVTVLPTVLGHTIVPRVTVSVPFTALPALSTAT